MCQKIYSKGGVTVEKEMIVLDCGFDFDAAGAPMGCCAGAFVTTFPF